MVYGTSCFKSRAAAERYYQTYYGLAAKREVRRLRMHKPEGRYYIEERE